MAKEGQSSSRGVPISKHKEPLGPTPIASYESRYLEDIQKHFDGIFGQECSVLHELVSTTVHLDILVYKPTRSVPFLTLVTSGMSDKKMLVPEEIGPPEDHELAELVAFLPVNWKLPEYSIEQDPHVEEGKATDDWGHLPVRSLKHYARFPHVMKTMLGVGQTVAGEVKEPIAIGTSHNGFLFAPALQLGEKLTIATHDHRRINLLNLVSLNPDELDFAIKNGGWALMKKLNAVENLVFDLARQSCIKRKKLFGLF